MVKTRKKNQLKISAKAQDVYSGMTSFFLVMFITVVVGIVLLGFSTIMIGALMTSTNYSLSQSAYESAISGIEDAKQAIRILQYCGDSNSSSVGLRASNINAGICERLNNAGVRTTLDRGQTTSCSFLPYVLGYIDDQADYSSADKTYLQSTYTKTAGGETSLSQSYGCTRIRNGATTFYDSLAENDGIKIIPEPTTQDDSSTISVTNAGYLIIRWRLSSLSYLNSGVGSDLWNDVATNALSGDWNDDQLASIQLGFYADEWHHGYKAGDLQQFFLGALSSAGSNEISRANHGNLVLVPKYDKNLSNLGVAFISDTDYGFGKVNRGFASSTHTHDELTPYNRGSLNAALWAEYEGENEPIEVFCDDTLTCAAIIEIPAILWGAVRDTAFFTISTINQANIAYEVQYLNRSCNFSGGKSQDSSTPYAKVVRNATSLKTAYNGSESDINYVATCGGSPDSKTNSDYLIYQDGIYNVTTTGYANNFQSRLKAQVSRDTDFPYPQFTAGIYCEASGCSGDDGQIKRSGETWQTN